jgi:single-strand DNA-binding protein
MAGETPITVVGNLTADPELRFTPSGAAVANFTVASTPRTFDRQTNDWKDGESLFLNCSVWRQAAENAAESLTRGMRVIVSGRLKARSYETREGEKRTVFEIDVDEVGPSMKYATAKVTKTSRSGGGQGYGSGGGGGDDPWATSPQGGARPPAQGGAAQGGGWGGNQGAPVGGGQSGGGQGDPWATSGGGHSEEPPF